MKYSSFILNGILLVAVGVLYYLHFSQKSGNTAAGTATVQTISSNGQLIKIAYINQDSLLRNYDFFLDVQQTLSAKQQKLESNLGTRQNEFQRKAVDFQQKVEKQLITRRQAEEMQQQLAGEEQSLLKLRDDLAMQLRNDEMMMTMQVNDSILSFLKSYNKTQNFVYVLNTAGGILYADTTLDITKVVLDGLNGRYGKKVETKKTDK